MLENMRRQGASIFVYLIFCLLIAIFIINFRPGQSRGQDSGCSGPNNLIVSVDGSDVTQTAYHIAYSNPYNRPSHEGEPAKFRTYRALEALIRRELLAQEATTRGLLATTDLVEEEIKKGDFFFRGERLKIPGIIDEDGLWNLNVYKRWMDELHVSKNSYEVEQQRSMLATLMAEMLKDDVLVSRDEALSQYLYDTTLVKYDVVAFNPEEFKPGIRTSDADIEHYLAAHADDVTKRFKTDERLYNEVPRQLRLREIFIAKPEPKAEPPKPEPKKDDKAGSGAGSGSAAPTPPAPPPPPPGPTNARPGLAGPRSTPEGSAQTIDELKAKLETTRAAIASGKTKFADAAKELSSDAELKASGGDLGWRNAEKPALGDKAVSDTIKALKPGEMTPVVATDKGVYLVMAEDERKGKLTFDQVKKEIAATLAKDAWAKEAAKRAALKALDEAKGKQLDTLFAHDQPEPYMAPIEIKKQIKQLAMMMRSSQIPDELRGQFYEQIAQLEQFYRLQRQQIIVAGTSPTPADAQTPTKDELPKIDAPTPKVVRINGAPRMQNMPAIGKSKEVPDALFDELGTGDVAKKVYEADGKYVVIQLVEKTQPKMEDFEKEAVADIQELRQYRANEMLEGWLKDRCETLVKAEKIKVNPEYTRETDDKGNLLPTQYRPCQSFR